MNGPAPVTLGTYTYRQSGSGTFAGFGSAINKPGTLDVHQPNAAGEQTMQMTIASNQPPSDQTLLFNGHGMFLVGEVQRFAVGNDVKTIQCSIHPGLPYPPWPVKVGGSFQGHTSCGSIHASFSGRVTGQRSTTIGGARVAVFIIKTTLDTTGEITSSSADTQWFAPSLRLPVKDVGRINGNYGVFGFHSMLTRTLVSTNPS